MRAEILRRLLKAHIERDNATFRKVAKQLAEAESGAGHTRIAAELRKLIEQMPSSAEQGVGGQVVDIAQPRGELAGVLEGGYRQERLRDIVLDDETRAAIERILLENRSRQRLEKFGVGPRRRLLFTGPPGCGKTLAAAVMAGELGVPLMTVRFDALFSRFLGATANHLRTIFQQMPRRVGVYLFDEFDAVAKARAEGQDVGEMHRVVIAFLQLIDADTSGGLLIAATNHPEVLDRAVFRRFDATLSFDTPGAEQIAELFRLRLGAFAAADDLHAQARQLAGSASYADIARICDNALRTVALDGRRELAVDDVDRAMGEPRVGS